MKTKILIIITVVFVINIIFLNINIVHADGTSDITKGVTGADNFIDSGRTGLVSIDESKLQNTSGVIYNILLLAGMSVAVITAGILGIKFMIGSAEEKAQIKDSLIPFIVGCVVVFGAFGIWKIFITIGSGL